MYAFDKKKFMLGQRKEGRKGRIFTENTNFISYNNLRTDSPASRANFLDLA